MKIAVIGLGYVGLVTSIVLSKKGFKVFGFDTDVSKINSLRKKKLYIKEKNLSNIFKSKIVDKNFTSNLINDPKIFFDTNFDIIIVAVGTPSKEGRVNLNYVKQVLRLIKNKMINSKFHTSVIIKSTVPPGTTDTIAKKILLNNKKIKNIGLGMNPEFLREGTAVDDFIKADRIVIGSDDKKTKIKLLNLYKSWKCKKIITNSRTAEMIKYSNNALLSLQISTANYLANLSRSVKNINVLDLFDGIHSDRRWSDINKKTNKNSIASYLRPGIGFGGSCLPKDLEGIVNIANKLNLQNNIFDVAKKINQQQASIISQSIIQILKNNKLKKVIFLGFSFKENTDDYRNSPTLSIVDELKRFGFFIYLHDYVLKKNAIETKYKNSKKIIYTSDWYNTISEEFLIIPIHKDKLYSKLKNNIRANYIFDPKNIFNKKDFLGSSYYDICV